MGRRRFWKPGTASEYDEFVPGQVVLSSQSANWSQFELTEFAFPAVLEGGPAPPLPSHAFALLTGGAIHGECSINGGQWTPRSADCLDTNMFYWPEGYECDWRWWPADENAKPPQLIIAYLKQSFLEKIAIEVLDAEPGCVELLNKLAVRDEFARQLILAVRNELAQGNPCGPVYAETAAQMLALHAISKHCALNRRVKVCKGGLSRLQLRLVLDYVNMHLHEEISLETLAALTGLTSYHFLRLFKQSTGETPLQFIIRSRMERAKKLLATRRVSVTDVALDVGYESVGHFIALFKRYTGFTPLAYQKRL